MVYTDVVNIVMSVIISDPGFLVVIGDAMQLVFLMFWCSCYCWSSQFK